MKCCWCSKEITENKACHEDCEDKYKKYTERVEKNKVKFALLLLGYFIVYMVLLLIEVSSKGFPYIAFSWLFGVLGLILVVFPFVTPQTIRLIGAKKSIIFIKIIGICFIAIGLIILIIK